MSALDSVAGRGLDKELPAPPIDTVAPRVIIEGTSSSVLDECEDGETQPLPSTPRPRQHLETSPLTLQGHSPPEAYLTPIGGSYESPGGFDGRHQDFDSPSSPRILKPSSSSEGAKYGLGVTTSDLGTGMRGLSLRDLPDPATFELPESSDPSFCVGPIPPAGHSSSSSSSTPTCSDVSSARFSISTRASIWTEKSHSSAATSPSTSGILKADSPLGTDPREYFNGSEPFRSGHFPLPNAVAKTAADTAPRSMEHRAISAGSLPPSETATLSGPFAHHRAPSWTRQTGHGGLTPIRTNSQHRHVPQQAVDSSSSPILPSQLGPFAVPDRIASRARTHSDGSKGRPGSSRSTKSSLTNGGADSNDSHQYTRGSNHSSVDSQPGSPGSAIGPRTSSLKRSSAKASFVSPPAPPPPLPALHLRQLSHDKIDATIRPAHLRHAASDSDSSTTSSMRNRRRAAVPDSFFCSASSYGLPALGSNSPEGYQSRGDGSDLPSQDSGLAVRAIEEGYEQIVNGQGRRAKDVEELIGPKTTHLLLSGCSGVDNGFLHRVLSHTGESLLVLDVSACGITSLPPCLTLCQALEELNVSHNTLVGHNPLSLCGEVQTLRVLLADSCGLRGLPRTFANLEKLQVLSIRNNFLTHIPSWVHRLALLEILLVQDNTFHRTWREITTLLVDSPLSSCFTSSDESWMKERSLSATTTVSSGTDTSLPKEDELEELDEEVGQPTSAPARSEAGRPAHAFRPLMRRMRSNNDIQRALDEPAALDEPDSSKQSPDFDSDGPRSFTQLDNEKGWGLFKRKLRKKASTSSLNSNASSLHQSKSRSNSILHLSQTSTDRLDILLPSADLKGSHARGADSGPTGAPPLSPFGDGNYVATPIELCPFKTYLRLSLPWNEAAPGAYHERRRHLSALRSLMAYLRDLDDLTPPSPRHLRTFDTSVTPGWRSGPASPISHSTTPDTLRTKQSTSYFSRSTSASSIAHQIEGERQPIKDDSVRRLKILHEIVVTEQTYLRGLCELVDIYVKPSKLVDVNSGVPWIPQSEHRKVFGEIEGIMQFHKGAFLPLLEAAIAPLRSDEVEYGNNAELTANVAEEMANVFLRHHAFFRMYSSYVNNVDASQRRIQTWMAVPSSQTHSSNNSASSKLRPSTSGGIASAREQGQQDGFLAPKERKRIRAFMQRARKDRRHSQLSLEAYLLLPVQRIPRYRLLLEDLARSTPEERLRDPASVKSALEAISTVASSMNESKRQSEKDRRLLAWQTRIRPLRGGSLNSNGRGGNDYAWPSPLVQPHRRLIMDGQVVLKRVVERTAAFHAPSESIWTEEEEEDALASIGESFSLGDELQDRSDNWRMVQQQPRRMVQVDRLEQTVHQRPLTLIVCNDICVAVVVSSDASGPADLYAIWRLRESPSSDGMPPVTIVGQSVLRIIDTKRILYCQAASVEEAETLRDALLQQVAHQQVQD